MQIRIWRDEPKRGESFAGWCYSLSQDGHVLEISHGHGSRAEALADAERAVGKHERKD